MNPTTAAIYAAATYSTTRLVIVDDIFAGTRARIQVWLIVRDTGWSRKLRDLLECWWCVGFWAAAGWVLSRRRFPKFTDTAATVMALRVAPAVIDMGIKRLDPDQ